MFTLFCVKCPTNADDKNPLDVEIIPVIPNRTPEKFGVKSIILASGPEDIAPCTIMASI